jgi:hypothetical protein
MALADNKPRTVTCPREIMFEITLAEDVVTGDLLYYSSGWKHAIADTGDVQVLVALEDGLSGEKIQATVGPAIISSFTGATAGAVLSSAADGAYQSGTGHRVGIFVSADTAVVLPLLATVNP